MNDRLTDDETEILRKLREQLARARKANAEKHAYYEARQAFESLNISIPPHLAGLPIAAGWPGTVVDVLEERLDWTGWSSVTDDSAMGLSDVYRDNVLTVESSRVHIDALITGTAFVTVGRGTLGEPDVLITAESPDQATVLWDYRTRRAVAGLSQTQTDTSGAYLETLYLPDQTIVLDRQPGKPTAVLSRDVHRLGRVPMVQIRNRDRATDLRGRSEITPAIRYLTDAACRTLLGMEINREFYTAPQRYALGAEPESFIRTEDPSPDELIRAGWTSVMGRFNVIPANEDGVIPEVGQFPQAPPTPYLEQLRGYSQLISAESGIPATYLGFVTDNPASADSIRQLEYRLVKRAERRQASFGQAWREVGRLALMVRDGSIDESAFRGVDTRWRDPATPTRAATADEALKLVSANILPADSTVTYDRIGLTDQDKLRLDADKRRARVAQLVQAVRPATPAPTPTTPGREQAQ